MKGILVIVFFVLCSMGRAQVPFSIPDSVRQNNTAEIEYIKTKIHSYQGGLYGRVMLTCYLSKLYNRAGRYQESAELVDQFTTQEYAVARGEVSLAKAVNFKYEMEPEKAKLLFDQALLQFTLDENYCMQMEVRIELMEYYRKFDLLELAVKEATEVERMLKVHKTCDPLVSIHYLNRLAAIQNVGDTDRTNSIKTSGQCIDSCLKYNEHYFLAVSYNEQAYAYQHIFELGIADDFYKKSEEIFRSLDLLSDALHVKMNRLRMYAHNRMNVPEIIPGLLEIEQVATESVPSYDLNECYRGIWVEASSVGEWELAFQYLRKFYFMDLARLENNIFEQLENVKQQEKESQTRIQNLILSTQVERQNNEIKQKRNTIWFVVLALVVLLSILVFLFRILKQRNRLTEDLRIRNEQKDQLIQEVHHRVKNNLSFVSSLLEMQINSLPEETKTEELKNASMRIESMSLVHQMLYNKDDIATIDLHVYIPELISYLQDSIVQKFKVDIEVSCEELKIESRNATALGLIVTEFVTNSYKHAFANIQQPKINLVFKTDGSKLTVTLKDNGVGFNPENSSARSGFGMRIIDIFSRQINAEVKFSFENGTQLNLSMNHGQ